MQSESVFKIIYTDKIIMQKKIFKKGFCPKNTVFVEFSIFG